MHKQLLLLHNAVSAYFSGNQQALEATMKQFSIKVKAPNSNEPSWIEQWKVYIYDFIKKAFKLLFTKGVHGPHYWNAIFTD